MKRLTRQKAGRNKVWRGFTLVELLVVISIITLLIAILLPALSAARQAAQTIQCLSNQRQFGIAIPAYANDHDGYYMPFRKSVPEYNNPSSSTWQPWDSILFRSGYLADGQVYLCPSMNNDHSAFFKTSAATTPNLAATNWYYTDYGYNYYHIGSSELGAYGHSWNPPARISMIKNISHTLVIADDQFHYFGSNPRQRGYAFLIYAPGNSSSAGYLDPRHQGGAVDVLWADGHATSNKVPTGRTTDANNPYSTLFKRGYYVGESDNVWDRD